MDWGRYVNRCPLCAGGDVIFYPLGGSLLMDAVARTWPVHTCPYQFDCAGVDVIFDPVGGSLLMESLKAARWGAHILIIGFASGGECRAQ